MSTEYTIRSGSKTVYLQKSDEGMYISINVFGGYLQIELEKEEALKVLEAVKDIIEGK